MGQRISPWECLGFGGGRVTMQLRKSPTCRVHLAAPVPLLSKRDMSLRLLVCCAVYALTVSFAFERLCSAADEQARDKQRGIALFEKTVKPLFEKQSFSCHSHASKKSSGGLVVDSLGALIAGGDSGPAVVPKKPAESLILNAIKRDEDFV